MMVVGVGAINPDKVRVTLGEMPANPGGGPGAGPAGGGAGSFSYETEKENAPKVWDVQTVSVNAP